MSMADKNVDNLRKAIAELSKWMEEDPNLDTMDQLAVENSIQMLQMIYVS